MLINDDSLATATNAAGAVNLQLDELQKVFDLFHTQLETVQQRQPTFGLGFPKPNSSQPYQEVQERVLKEHGFEEVQIME